jgi:uncharacterized membrane protein
MNSYPPWNRGGVGPSEMHFHNGGPPTLEWLVFALLLVAVLTLGTLLVSRLAVRSGRWSRTPATTVPAAVHDPLDVLRFRYARGEISRDEYLQGTADLTPPQPAAPPPD